MTNQKLKLSLAVLAVTQLWATGVWATNLSIDGSIYTSSNPYTGPVTITDTGVVSVTNSYRAIENTGSNTTIENGGYIARGYGIYNDSAAIITTLTNNGSITGGRFGIYNDSAATITTLTNNESITGDGDLSDGIYNYGGAIGTLTNNGSITGGSDGIYNYGAISTLTNNGSINSHYFGIYNDFYSTITTLTNNGSINSDYFGISNDDIITTLTNNGSITGGSDGIENYATITTLTNNGSIAGNSRAIFNYADATITTLTNNGSINSHYFGILNNGTITTLTNNGNITGGGIGNDGIITTLTNNGNITGGGIVNYYDATITTLNNAQGGDGLTPATTALTYGGNLPTNYNIIINSATHYGQLATDGTTSTQTTFGIDAGSNVTNRLYSHVLSGVARDYVNSTYLTGPYDNMRWQLALENGSSNFWNLTFAGVSLAQTQASLAQSAQALRGVYDLQNVAINNNLNNDCTLFDVHGICTSVTGTQNYLSGGVNNDTTSGKLTVAYRVNDNVRIGAYLDQNLITSNVTGVHLNNGSPAFGAFAVWNANADGLGTQIRVAAGYADKDLTVTRSAVQTSEAGTGTTSLNSYGASAIASYAMAMPGDFIFSPYAGIRYTKVSADGYTEGTSSSVTDPLTYSALTQNATTALVGTKWTRRIAENAVAYASIGLEQDLNNNGGTYTATSANIVGLTPIAFNPNINHSRPTASIGSYVNLGDRQRVAANLVWSEEAFTTANATSLMITYMAGF